MNSIDTILAENENFVYVSCVFAPYTGEQEYTFKTTLPVKQDEFVVVRTKNGKYQVVQVRNVMDPMSARLDARMDYTWVIQKVDFDHYDRCVEAEEQIRETVNRAIVRKQRKELRSHLDEYLSDEDRAQTSKLIRL